MSTDKLKRQADRENSMRTGPIPGTIMRMAYPTIIAFLITSIYSMADIYFVSSLGTNATAAVSVNSSLDIIILMCGSVFGIGANSYIARLLGAKNSKRANTTLSTAFFLAAAVGTLIMLLGISFRRPLVKLLGATDTCEKYAIDYATYVLYAAPFMASSFVMNQSLRAEGNALFSMVGMGIGGIINCFLDPIFILPWGLGMGVAGASLATAISKIISFCILVFPYISRRSLLKLSIRNFAFDMQIIGEIVSIGSSAMCRNLLNVFTGILLNREAGMISDSVLACVGVGNKVLMFPFSIIIGFSTGFQPVAGYNWGALQYDRVKESRDYATKTAFIGALIMASIIGIFAPQIITWFAGTDEEMLRIGTLCIRLQCIALPIHSWVAVINGMASALGKAKYAVILATARQGTCFLPILYPLSRLFGAYGIASVQAIADVLTIFLAVPILKKINRMIDEAASSVSAPSELLTEKGGA